MPFTYAQAREERQRREDWYAELQHKRPHAKHELRLAWQALKESEQKEDEAKAREAINGPRQES